jgi:hypothetical protein
MVLPDFRNVKRFSSPVREWPLKVRFTGDDIAVCGAKARRETEASWPAVCIRA